MDIFVFSMWVVSWVETEGPLGSNKQVNAVDAVIVRIGGKSACDATDASMSGK